MFTKVELENTITSINDIFLQFIEYIDSLSFTDSNDKEYTTSETLISNTKKSAYSSIQYLEELKKDGLTEFSITPVQDTTIFDLCFLTYKIVNDENIDKLINANDLLAYNRTDIDPNNPIIKKGTKILYYK